jgi:hypothetical protein
MLIDELEERASALKQKKDGLRDLHRQYRQFYSKDIRDEIAVRKAEIAKMRSEASELVWEGLEELLLIKRYFPDLYSMLLDDPGIGDVIRRRDWLVDRKEEDVGPAEKRLKGIKRSRHELREAREFVDKWPGKDLDERSLVATWPALKGTIKGDVHKSDAIAAIDRRQKELVREGWKVLLNASMIAAPLRRFLAKAQGLKSEELAKRVEMNDAKGKGSVKEYEAKKAYENAKAARERMERICRHLLLASPLFLDAMKKELKAGKRDKGELERIVASTSPRRINEQEWLKEMRKKTNGA